MFRMYCHSLHLHSMELKEDKRGFTELWQNLYWNFGSCIGRSCIPSEERGGKVQVSLFLRHQINAVNTVYDVNVIELFYFAYHRRCGIYSLIGSWWKIGKVIYLAINVIVNLLKIHWSKFLNISFGKCLYITLNYTFLNR